MARFSFNGMDRLQGGVDKLLSMDEESVMGIVRAGGGVIKRHQSAYLRKHHNRTGELADSIQIIEEPDKRSVRIEAQGVKNKWTAGKGWSMRKVHSRSGATRRKKHHGATKSSTMIDVAYYLAVGTKKLRATDWDKKANEAAEAEVWKTMEDYWNSVLENAGF